MSACGEGRIPTTALTTAPAAAFMPLALPGRRVQVGQVPGPDGGDEIPF
jgi:hypothetical protein